MRRLANPLQHFLCCLMVVFLPGCAPDSGGKAAAVEKPRRVVSLDYCADQYLLKLADRDQILALSRDATKSFSYLRAEAEGLPTVRAVAEDVLSLAPDLIIRSYGGGANAPVFFARAGVPVVQLPWVSSVDGDGAQSIPGVIAFVARELGQPARGDALISDFRNRLRSLRRGTLVSEVMYMSAAGYTSGPGTLIHEMLLAAGLRNYENRQGWHPLPLEALVYKSPDRVASAFFVDKSSHRNGWSAARHPVAAMLRERSSTVALDGATTSCGAWFLADAIEALASGAPQR